MSAASNLARPIRRMALGFVAMTLSTLLLTMALAAMGLETDARKLRARGLRPFALGAAINLADVSTVRLSGHFARLEPWLREPLHRQLQGRVVWARRAPLEITALTDAPLRPTMGAGLAAMAPVVKDPESWLAAAG